MTIDKPTPEKVVRRRSYITDITGTLGGNVSHGWQSHRKKIFLSSEEFFANLALFDLEAFSKLIRRGVAAGTEGRRKKWPIMKETAKVLQVALLMIKLGGGRWVTLPNGKIIRYKVNVG